jgi:hypothetical protein
MLQCMSSLSLLAHHAGAPALTATGIAFFATAATVTPVLFIAIAVQGKFQQDLLDGIAYILRRLSQRPSGRPVSKTADVLQAAVNALVVMFALPVVAMLFLLILLFGAFGELGSIAALTAQVFGAQMLAPFSVTQVEKLVVASVALLTLVAVATSVLTLGKHVAVLFRRAIAHLNRQAAFLSEGPDDGGFFDPSPRAGLMSHAIPPGQGSGNDSRATPGKAPRTDADVG